MLKKFVATGLTLVLAASAFAQSTSLVQVDNVPTAGADLATFQRNVTHWTYDLRGSDVASPAFWTGSEVTVNVGGSGSIWHATDQNLGDPNAPGFPNNVLPPIPAPPATNTARYDTFFTAPGAAFVTPSFASPGGITSTPTIIHGNAPDGTDIPLAWFVTAANPLNNTTLARFTFQTPAGLGLSLTQSAAFPNVFATMTGRTTSSTNPNGNNFSLTIYQAPEPSTLALLALGGLAGLIRRR